MHPPLAIEIRSCVSYADCEPCVALQEAVWHYPKEQVVPAHMFAMAIHIGGHALVAYHEGAPIGFTLAFPARRDGVVYLHSDMAAVLPGWQGKGIGMQLKLEQKRLALRQGIERIEWTFDPLALRNAHFNICRLGARVRRVIPNAYGEGHSPLDGHLPTDRFVAEWQLAGVERAIADDAESRTIAIPLDIDSMKTQDPQRALAVQQEVSAAAERYFAEGYVISDFSQTETHGLYRLGRYAN